MPINKGSFAIIGIALRTDNSKAAVEISQHWERFRSQNIPAQIPNKKSNAVYAVYTDYVSDHTKPYTLILGCEVAPDTAPPPGFVLKQIPASAYTSFTQIPADPRNIFATWQKVWQSNIPRAYTADFEFYDPNLPTVSLYIALKDQERCACHCR